MDLISTVRKSGSRGGVNFSWDEVANSTHRENYLGHSLKAPVGRWQKGRDLNWYAKAGDDDSKAGDGNNETPQERQERERREELRKIKEAEEDALARALGLPVSQRDTSGANAVEVSGSRNMGPAPAPAPALEEKKGGLMVKEWRERRDKEENRERRRRHRSRSPRRERRRDDERRSRERDRADQRRRRERDGERERESGRVEDRERRCRGERREHRRRSMSREGHRPWSRDRRRSHDQRH